MDPIWLTPPPGLPAAASAVARPAEAGEPPGGLAAIVAAGGAGTYAWALDGPDAARRAWREQARLGLAVLERRLERPGADTDRFALGSQVSTVAQWAWLGDRPDTGRRADLVATELAIGGWPGREPLDSPALVLLCDPTGEHARPTPAPGCGWAGSVTSRWPVPRAAGPGAGPVPWTGCSTTSTARPTWAGRSWERPRGWSGPWSIRRWGRPGHRRQRSRLSAGWPPWLPGMRPAGRSRCLGCSRRPSASRPGWRP